MSYVNLTAEERKILIDGILQSDLNYLNTLLERKNKLLLEMHLLEGSILKKVQEIEGMKTQFNMVDTYH